MASKLISVLSYVCILFSASTTNAQVETPSSSYGQSKALTSPSIELRNFVAAPTNFCSSATVGNLSMNVSWTSYSAGLPNSARAEMLQVGNPTVLAEYQENAIGFPSPATNSAETYGLLQSNVIGTWTVPDNSTLTIRVTTWPTADWVGPPSFVSELDTDCTTGEILAIRNSVPSAPSHMISAVPVGGFWILFGLVLALGASAASSGRYSNRGRI